MAKTPYCPHCYSPLSVGEIQYYRPVCFPKSLAPAKLNFLQKLGICPPPLFAECTRTLFPQCKTCDRKMGFCACPRCKGEFPSAMLERSTRTLHIALVGDEGCGKSTWMEAVVERFRQLSTAFGWSVMEQYAGNGKSKLFCLHNRGRNILLSLSESRGETLNSPKKQALSGIILMTEPGTFTSVTANSSLAPAKGSDETFLRLLGRIKKEFTGIPVAVTLNKTDLLRNHTAGKWELRPSIHRVCRDCIHNGSLDAGEQGTISCEMSAWLSAADTRLQKLLMQDAKCALFGCSSKSDALRAEEPLLWIMAQNGFIKQS